MHLKNQAAINIVRPVIEAALQGKRLPIHTDPDFQQYAEAVCQLGRGEDFEWLGKAAMVVLGNHVIDNFRAQRGAGPLKDFP